MCVCVCVREREREREREKRQRQKIMAFHILTKSRHKDLRQLSKKIYKGKRREIRFLSLSFFDYDTADLHLDLFFTDFKYIFMDYGLNRASPLPTPSSHSLVVLYNGN